MAKLNGPPPFLGTRDGLFCYVRWGQTYITAASTLTGKRVKKAPEFKKTMEEASFMARASKIASKIYRGLPQKKFQKYRELTGQAVKMLKAGMEEEHILKQLAAGTEF